MMSGCVENTCVEMLFNRFNVLRQILNLCKIAPCKIDFLFCE